MNVVIVGCGDIGVRCAGTLQRAGHRVMGVRRNSGLLPDTIEARSADVCDPSSLKFLADQPIDVLIYSLAAENFNESDYRAAYVDGVKNVLAALGDVSEAGAGAARLALKRIFFISSTGVYHQNDGSVVDENSPTEPARFNGQLMLEGETLIRDTGIGTCIRFSGIYGPDRLRMINRVAAGQGSKEISTAYTNRIHVEDCAAVIAHLVECVQRGQTLEQIYLASDCGPATSTEVERFIAETLGLVIEQSGSSASAAVNRIAGSKRCNNKRLLDSGYQFIYPDYRAGYAKIIEQLRSSSQQ